MSLEREVQLVVQGYRTLWYKLSLFRSDYSLLGCGLPFLKSFFYRTGFSDQIRRSWRKLRGSTPASAGFWSQTFLLYIRLISGCISVDFHHSGHTVNNLYIHMCRNARFSFAKSLITAAQLPPDWRQKRETRGRRRQTSIHPLLSCPLCLFFLLHLDGTLWIVKPIVCPLIRLTG